jgi:glutamate formiminotransferase
MNVIDVERAPLHEVVERVRLEAEALGAGIAAGELVGLVPQRVLDEAALAGVEIPGVDERHVLETLVGNTLGWWPGRSS